MCSAFYRKGIGDLFNGLNGPCRYQMNRFWFATELLSSCSYVLVNKNNLVHNLFLVDLSISTCFGRLCAHHQEKQLCFCDTWYLLFCVDDCPVCRSICSCIPDSTKCRKNTVVSPNDGHIGARNMSRLINLLRINCAPSCFYLEGYTETHGQHT